MSFGVQVGKECPLVIKWTSKRLVPIRFRKFMSAAIDDLVGCGMLNAVPVGPISDNRSYVGERQVRIHSHNVDFQHSLSCFQRPTVFLVKCHIILFKLAAPNSPEMPQVCVSGQEGSRDVSEGREESGISECPKEAQQ